MSLKDFNFSQLKAASGLTFGANVQMKSAGAKVYGMCGAGYKCSGGGGQCGAGYQCTGGGGHCGAGYQCSGS